MSAPYYDADGVTIYHGDCRDVCADWYGLRTKPFDLLLTDPPYGLGDRWTGGTWGSDPMYTDARRWDARVPDGDLIALVSLATDAIIWGGNYYRMPPSRCWLAWVKRSRMDTLADLELAWTTFDRPAKLITEDRNPEGKRQHPTQKPESVMLWALTQAPATIVRVFDPFMGSGTTLAAAKRLGKIAIGIDCDERYCEIAANRLRQAALPLFEGATA